MYSELDRTYIRRWVGFGAIYLQAEPRLESAISATQSIADGGSRPDSSTENFVKSILWGSAATTGTSGVTPGGTTQDIAFAMPFVRGLIQVESNIARLDAFVGAIKVDKDATEIDSGREVKRLRAEGRRLVHALTRMLGMKGPRADMFSSAPIIRDDDVFANDNYSRDPWRWNWP
jgi:hypothetical protein